MIDRNQFDLSKEIPVEKKPVSKKTISKHSNPSFLCLESFLGLSLIELESRSGINSSYWCRWFKGDAVTEQNLKKAGERLGMSAGTLLDFIIQRRRVAKLVSASGRRYRTNEALRQWRKQKKREGDCSAS